MKKIRQISLFLIVIISSSAYCFSQNKELVDSLNTQLSRYKKANNGIEADTNIIKTYFELGKQYKENAYDTALIYFNNALELSWKISSKSLIAESFGYIGLTYNEKEDYELALEYFFQSLKLRKEIKDISGISISLSNIGSVYWSQNKIEQALEYYNNSIAWAEKINDYDQLSNCYFNTGSLHWGIGEFNQSIESFEKCIKIDSIRKDTISVAVAYSQVGNGYLQQGKYDLAIRYFQKSIKIIEPLINSGDHESAIYAKTSISYSLNNIGNVHVKQKNYDIASEYYLKSLKMKEEIDDKHGVAGSYTSLGAIAFSLKDYPLAIKHFEKSLSLYTALNHKTGMSKTYGNLGVIYKLTGNYDVAIDYYQKALLIKKEINDKHGTAIVLVNLAMLQISYADSVATTNSTAFKYYNNAILNAEEAMKIGKEIDALPRISLAAQVLKDAYARVGNYKKAYEYGDIYIVAKDSMFNKEKIKAIQDAESRFQAEKKQLEIEKLENQQLLDNQIISTQKAENKKQKIVISAIIGGLILVIFILIILVRLIRQKKIANAILEQKNEEISAQRDEIEAQRDLAAAQRDLIAEQKQDITDSIEYAYKIQSAIFPDAEDIKLVLRDYFILYKPRDIVSGDFYWINKVDGKIIILAADCTGHGVPGAFMSMLGIAFLNEIVNKENITMPDQILNRLRENIILALKQHGDRGVQRDGMDVAAITIDPVKQKLYYAGANNPLYLIRNNELIERKGNKMPVAIHYKMEPFKSNEIDFNTGDLVYLFSDGYPDQFGGPQGKKFKYKPFKELLVKISDQPMDKQKQILHETFDSWSSGYNQIDDVLVLGIRV